MSRRHEIAELIRSDLPELRRKGLPSLRGLADRYGTSRVSVTQAVEALSREGVLVYTPGRRPRFPEDARNRSEFPRRAHEWLAERIRAGVDTGRYRLGDLFPKVTYFTSLYSVSSHTVRKALDLLKRESISRKVGRRWYVGVSEPGPERPPVIAPAILFVQGSRRNWDSLVSSDRTEFFCAEFMDGARARGVEVVFATQSVDPGGNIPNAGAEAARETALALGPRYLGMVAFIADPQALTTWLSAFAAFRRPTVVFAEALSFSGGLKAGHEHLLWALADEMPGVRLAVNSLAAEGHRVVGYFSRHPVEGWRLRRLEQVREVAMRRGMEVVCVDDVSRDTAGPAAKLPSRAAVYQDLLDSGPPTIRSFLGGVLDTKLALRVVASTRAPGEELERAARAGVLGKWYREAVGAAFWTSRIAPLVSTPGLTAVICAHDEDAEVLERWLRIAGVSVPRDLSLLSFDNYLRLADNPVTTIDFGFARMGYTALRVLLGDIRPKPSWKGRLPLEPSLSERGSVRAVRRE